MIATGLSVRVMLGIELVLINEEHIQALFKVKDKGFFKSE